MASTKDFIDYIVEQVESTWPISFRKMFGEYALYCNGKVVALICDDQLFIKPTEGGRAFIENLVEAPPYPGAKLWFLIEDKYENREWLSRLIEITEKELPMPKPKAKKRMK